MKGIPDGWREWDEEKKRALLRKLRFSWSLYARQDQLPPEGDWLVWMLRAGRGSGKDLDLSTPLPTPSGWTTMGEVQPGDDVFAPDGTPTRVTYVSPVHHDLEAYRITFSDHTEIVANADHEWVTRTHNERRRAHRKSTRSTSGVRTTKEIFLTFKERHSIPNTLPLQLPEAGLPIDPYTLGAWLGDGYAREARICGVDDQIFDEVACHYELTDDHYLDAKKPGWRKVRTARIGCEKPGRDSHGYSAARGPFNEPLHNLGLTRAKHIPPVFLRASEPQRLALLQGLMDTDGHISKQGTAEVGFVNRKLAEGTYELVISLGFSATWNIKMVNARGGKTREFYRINFNPRGRPVVRLARKLERLRDSERDKVRYRSRFIMSIEPVPSVPMRCIAVAHPSHQYLASEAMIPTHNTRVGSEWVRAKAEERPVRIGVLCPTYGAVRDVAYEGDSGLLTVLPPDSIDAYNRSLHQITLTNGSRIFGYSGSDPERLRGPQHHYLWCDELAVWPYLRQTWDNAQFGLRLGQHPQTVITTTPRPIPFIKELEARQDPNDVVITTASTFDNAANLPEVQLLAFQRQYGGTHLGMQELMGLIIEDLAGALWVHDTLENNRVEDPNMLPHMQRVVVGVDPAASVGGMSADTGIVVVGKGKDGEGYVLADRSVHGSPDVWARAVKKAFDDFRADRVVVERNHGGDMVVSTLQTIDPLMPIKTVWASRGKFVRAEPVAALYEQGRMHHVGLIPVLEDQMLTWLPADPKAPSPDRVDALVWATVELGMTGGEAQVFIADPSKYGTVPVL